jgi:hypothetical protein
VTITVKATGCMAEFLMLKSPMVYSAHNSTSYLLGEIKIRNLGVEVITKL